MITVEEVTELINKLKARMYEINQESKIITSKIAFYSGQLEILNEYNNVEEKKLNSIQSV